MRRMLSGSASACREAAARPRTGGSSWRQLATLEASIRDRRSLPPILMQIGFQEEGILDSSIINILIASVRDDAIVDGVFV